MTVLITFIQKAIGQAVGMLFGATGEIITEKSGNLNLGIFNATDYPIKIQKGMRVAQIVFEELDGIPSEHKLYKNKENAAYQNEKGDRGANFEKEVNDFVDRILAKGE